MLCRTSLPNDQQLRFQASFFNGTKEHGSAPSPTLGSDLLRERKKLWEAQKSLRKQNDNAWMIMISMMLIFL